MITISQARAILRRAEETNPEAVRRAEMHEAVASVDFKQEMRGIPQPSFAALTPQQREEAERKLHSAQQNQARELEARERRAAQRERDVKTLQAGQTIDNQALVAATAQQG